MGTVLYTVGGSVAPDQKKKPTTKEKFKVHQEVILVFLWCSYGIETGAHIPESD